MVHIKAALRVQITYTPEAMVQLTCTIVHPKLSIMCSQFWKGHRSCPATLTYPRVHRCILASKTPLSVHGVCTLWPFQMPTHYGTTRDIPRCPRVFLGLLGPGTSDCQSLGHPGISWDVPGWTTWTWDNWLPDLGISRDILRCRREWKDQ